MRKPKSKPDMAFGIPADRAVIRKCHMVLAAGDGWPFPEDTARELAAWIISNVRLPKLSGPEIAAMVDFRAARTGTIAQAAETVCDLLAGRFSLEAILQAHKRYGRTAKSIRTEAQHRRLQLEAMEAADAEMHDEERRELDEVLSANRMKIERMERAWQEYVAAKKDIFG